MKPTYTSPTADGPNNATIDCSHLEEEDRKKRRELYNTWSKQKPLRTFSGRLLNFDIGQRKKLARDAFMSWKVDGKVQVAQCACRLCREINSCRPVNSPVFICLVKVNDGTGKQGKCALCKYIGSPCTFINGAESNIIKDMTHPSDNAEEEEEIDQLSSNEDEVGSNFSDHFQVPVPPSMTRRSMPARGRRSQAMPSNEPVAINENASNPTQDDEPGIHRLPSVANGRTGESEGAADEDLDGSLRVSRLSSSSRQRQSSAMYDVNARQASMSTTIGADWRGMSVGAGDIELDNDNVFARKRQRQDELLQSIIRSKEEVLATQLEILASKKEIAALKDKEYELLLQQRED